jgi:hypothetical protein
VELPPPDPVEYSVAESPTAADASAVAADEPDEKESPAREEARAASEIRDGGGPVEGHQRTLDLDTETIVETFFQQPDVDLVAAHVHVIEQGDAVRGIGPLFRVSIANRGTSEVTTPFDIALVVATGLKPTTESPYALRRVTSIGAGQRRTLEIRLPAEVLQMGIDAEGRPVRFRNVFVGVDTGKELEETNEQNNAIRVARADVQPAKLLAATSK